MPSAFATVGPGDGPDLRRWPLLAWTAEAGVVTEDHQIPVAVIGRAPPKHPDALAHDLGTTADHVRQALDYMINGVSHV
jgi:hypothetical protein